MFSGIKIVKGFGREAYEGGVSSIAMRVLQVSGSYGRKSSAHRFLNVLALELLGWCFMAASRLSLAPPRLARFSFCDHYYEPMRKLGRVNSVLQRSLAAAVFTVLDTPAEQPEERKKPAISPSRVSMRIAPILAGVGHHSHRQSG